MPTPAMLLGMEAEKVQVRSKKCFTTCGLSHNSGLRIHKSEDVITSSAIISKLLCVSFTTGKCLSPGLEEGKMSYRHNSLDCVSGF